MYEYELKHQIQDPEFFSLWSPTNLREFCSLYFAKKPRPIRARSAATISAIVFNLMSSPSLARGECSRRIKLRYDHCLLQNCFNTRRTGESVAQPLEHQANDATEPHRLLKPCMF